MCATSSRSPGCRWSGTRLESRFLAPVRRIKSPRLHWSVSRTQPRSLDLIRFDPAVEVAAVQVHAPALAHHNQFPLVDHVLDGLL